MEEVIKGGEINTTMTSSFDSIGSQPMSKDEVLEKVQSSIQEKLKKLPSIPSACSIWRVPETLRKDKPEAYTPLIVSIGPLHHGLQHLRPMEARKVQFLNDFVHRRVSKASLPGYIKAMTDLEETARQCYQEVSFSQDRFVTMMLVDGCFILELILREDGSKSFEKWSFLVYFDLILLENQLPFSVLEKLYELYLGDTDGPDLSDLIRQSLVQFFLEQLLCKSSGDDEQIPPNGRAKHLLDFLRYFLIPSVPTPSSPSETSGVSGDEQIQKPGDRATKYLPACIVELCLGGPQEEVLSTRSAKELEKAGVKFVKNKNQILTNLLDIKFDEAKGVLTIQKIKIDHGTESILRNLVAYEQYNDDHSYITEYAGFVDGLIDTSRDVEVLQEHGIVETILGDPGEVAALFNNLLKDVMVPFNYTYNVCNEVEQYYNKPWHKWKASLMLNYFNTPWASISVVAAVILLALTIIQTIYTLLAFYK